MISPRILYGEGGSIVTTFALSFPFWKHPPFLSCRPNRLSPFLPLLLLLSSSCVWVWAMQALLSVFRSVCPLGYILQDEGRGTKQSWSIKTTCFGPNFYKARDALNPKCRRKGLTSIIWQRWRTGGEDETAAADPFLFSCAWLLASRNISSVSSFSLSFFLATSRLYSPPPFCCSPPPPPPSASSLPPPPPSSLPSCCCQLQPPLDHILPLSVSCQSEANSSNQGTHFEGALSQWKIWQM
jgi:hypothetical protein